VLAMCKSPDLVLQMIPSQSINSTLERKLKANQLRASARGDAAETESRGPSMTPGPASRAPSGLGREWRWIQKPVELRSQERVGDRDRSPLYRDLNVLVRRRHRPRQVGEQVGGGGRLSHRQSRSRLLARAFARRAQLGR
jgi:hypothetical protein